MRKTFLIFSFILFSCTTRYAHAKELLAFVGSASKPPTEELAALFEKNTGIKVRLHFGSSGAMLSQMELTRKGDIYFPGSPDFMEKAKKKGLVYTNTEKIVAYLVPVINVRKGNPKNIKSLGDLARPNIKIAIANPEVVCVGLYAVEILAFNHMIEKIRPNIVTYTESCAKTASIIALGSVDAVLGWDVFQHWNPKKIEAIPLQPQQIPRLAYLPIAISKFTADLYTAQTFIEFITSKGGKDIFRKHGYIVTEEEAKKQAPQASIGGEYTIPASWFFKDMAMYKR